MKFSKLICLGHFHYSDYSMASGEGITSWVMTKPWVSDTPIEPYTATRLRPRKDFKLSLAHASKEIITKIVKRIFIDSVSKNQCNFHANWRGKWRLINVKIHLSGLIKQSNTIHKVFWFLIWFVKKGLFFSFKLTIFWYYYNSFHIWYN